MVHAKNKVIKNYLNLLLSLYEKDTWDHLNPCDVLLARHDNDCGYVFHDRAYAQIIDSFGELCESQGLIIGSIAIPFSRYVGKKATYSSRSCNRAFFIYSVLGKLLSLIIGKADAKRWSDNQITKFWSRILECGKPRIVIGIQPDKNLCKACKNKKIPVFDIQHGVFSENDEYYGADYHKHVDISKIPDGFLCWDDDSAEIIKKWAYIENIPIYIIGNLWFQRFLNPRMNDILVNEAKSAILDSQLSHPRILLSLQGGLSDKYPDIPNNIMSPSLEKVIMDTLDKYSWRIRFHPIQLYGDERQYAISYLNATFGKEKTLKWIQESQIALPIILQNTDLHITSHSSVVTEAAWMGIRSGILSERVRDGEKYNDLFLREQETGLAEIIPNDSESIQQWISITLNKSKGETTFHNYQENLNQFIEKLSAMAQKNKNSINR